MNQHKGFSLIELMIAMLIGIIVIGGTISIYISTIRGSSDTVKSARLNYDLDSVMQLMVNDIRRAGYWGGAIAGSDAQLNPFTFGFGSLLISNKAGEAANTCILYTYDANASGANTLGDNSDDLDLDEYFGFRLNGNGIDMRYSVGDTANISCDDPSWENIINTNKIVITGLTFSISNSQCLNTTTSTAYVDATAPIDNSCIAAIAAGSVLSGEQAAETRQIDITIQGNVKNETPVTKSLTAIIKVRNDRIFTQP